MSVGFGLEHNEVPTRYACAFWSAITFYQEVGIVSDNNTFVLPISKLTGLQVMMLGDAEVDALWSDELVGITGHSYWNEDKIILGTIPPVASTVFSSERLRDLLMAICLRYPFWNDFRILDFFSKRGISMAMEELRSLRSECGIENKEDVCLELMQLYFNHQMKLEKKQVQFIERVNPAFRDRDFLSGRPGELLVYECIFFRRLNKMFYIHLVFDLFNGYAFGKVSRRCSGEVGLRLLQEKIVPFYRSRDYQVNCIVHSIKSTREHWEQEESNIRENVLGMGIEWLEPKHEFGIIQRFQRDYLEPFFNDAEALDVSLVMIQPAFDRWMMKYNATCSFNQRRNFLGHVDCFHGMDRLDLESKSNFI